MHATKAQTKDLGRIRKRPDFVRIQNKARKWTAHGLAILASEKSEGGSGHFSIRIGFTVTKKIDKSAVARNRMKRRLRAVAADVLPVYAKSGMDYILIARSQTATRSYDDLCNDLRWCLRKLDLANTDKNGTAT